MTANTLSYGLGSLIGNPSNQVLARFTNLKVRPFEPTGSWTSNAYDLTRTPTTQGTISWRQDLGAGTRLDIQTATSADGIAWSVWSPAYPTADGSVITSPPNRFIRVAATFYADATRQNSPVLDSIKIEYPDATPLGPVLSSSTHPAGLWSPKNGLDLAWLMPLANPAPEGDFAYNLRLNGSLTQSASVAVTDTAGATHHLGLPLAGEGAYTLDLQVTGDSTSGGRTSTASSYAFNFDATAPGATLISSQTHPQLLFANNRNPVFHLAATDAMSGISGWATVLDKVAVADPGGIVNAGADLRYRTLDNGTWYLHARAVDMAGNTGPVSHYGIRVDYTGDLLSVDYVKALPNPVRTNSAVMEYELAAPATEVKLEWLNSQGEVIKTQDGSKDVGKNRVTWDCSNLANGLYYFKIRARSAEDGRSYSAVRKVAVVR